VSTGAVQDYSWHASSGQFNNISFYDPLSVLNHQLSGLTTAYYKIFTSSGMSGTQITPWTAINSTSSYAFRLAVESVRLEPFAKRHKLRIRQGRRPRGQHLGLKRRLLCLKDTLPPTMPLLSSPADGAFQSTTTVSFAWSSAVDVHSGISSYDLSISTDQNFSVLSSSANTVLISTTAVLPGKAPSLARPLMGQSGQFLRLVFDKARDR